MSNNKKMKVPLDDSWFLEKKNFYLDSEPFREFEKCASINLEDLFSQDQNIRRRTQEKLAKRSVMLNEIRNSHFGYGFPFFIYTQELGFFEKVPNHNLELDKIMLRHDMVDSLRRRHIALSYSILPMAIKELNEKKQKPIIIENLGSGVGLDALNALRLTNGSTEKTYNYDINPKAITLGKKITKHLEEKGLINVGVVEYIEKNITESREMVDLAIMVGIICGLEDRYAKIMISKAKKNLNEGGILVISSSNSNMRKTDPASNFVIQHIGSGESVFEGWSLNFREKDQMYDLIKSTGFKEVEIYDDANYPLQENLPEKIKHGIDCLPSITTGLKDKEYKPIALPSKEILDKKTGYNWIAVARK